MNKGLINTSGEFDSLPTLSEQGELLAKSYLRHFSSYGYNIRPPVSIASDIDPSVLFIGSTISIFKSEFLTGSIGAPGTVVIQPCLRTQNGDSLYNLEECPDYCSHFHMIGGIAPTERLHNVIEDTLAFFVSVGFSKDQIIIRTTEKDDDLIDASRASHPSQAIELNSRGDNYYRWKYGMEGVSGRGLTFAIKEESNDFARDIGNIIVMEKDNGTSAIQWGYGVETLLSRLHSFNHPIRAGIINSIMTIHSDITLKVADALVSSLEMYNAEVTPGRRRRGSRLTTYTRGLNFLRKAGDMNPEDIFEISKVYQNETGGNKEMAAMLCDQMTAHEEKVKKFTDHAVELIQMMSKVELLEIVTDPVKNIPLSNTFAVHQKEMARIVSLLHL